MTERKHKTIKSTEKWYIADAEGKILGRLAAAVAQVIYGKHNPNFRKDLAMGDHVIVVNASKIKVTGKKLLEKTYKRFSGYPGGLHETRLDKMLQQDPEYVIMHAVKGMLPKNKVGSEAIRKLRVYAGSEHHHPAQKPEPLKI